MLQLIHYPLCPFSRSIRLSLAELGISANFIEERPWEWRSDFLDINPAGTLPVLLVNDKTPICGTYAITEYLSETAVELYGAGHRFTLFPGDALQSAEIRRLIDWFHIKLNSEVSSFLLEEKVYAYYQQSSEEINLSLVKVAQENLKYHLRYIGYLSERRNWLAGHDMSFADLAAASHLSSIDYLGDVPWEESIAAKTWYSRVKSRPSFRQFLNEKIPGLRPAHIYADLDF